MLSSLGLAPNGQRHRLHRENEKANLVTICRLVLRAFYEDSMKRGRRVVEGDVLGIADLLIILEKTLWHGYKGNRSLLAVRTPDAELWLSLQRLCSEREDIAQSVSCVHLLEHLPSAISKIRCLLRLCIMQKKLVDLLTTISSSPVIRDHYERWALLCSEEKDELIGSLAGLSAIECSLLIEYDHIMEQPSSIDLSSYIKMQPIEEYVEDEDSRRNQLILDQNSFLEERNRVLQTRLDAAKAKVQEMERELEARKITNEFHNVIEASVVDEGAAEKEERWNEERNSLCAQIIEKEDAIRYAEQHLKDTKMLNTELYEQLRKAEQTTKTREKELLFLLDNLKQENAELKKKLEEKECEQKEQDIVLKENEIKREDYERKCQQHANTLAILETKQKELKELRTQFDALKRESEEKDNSLQELKFTQLAFAEMSSKYEESRSEVEELATALEELGGRLSESKLKVLELKEELQPVAWTDDAQVANCTQCKVAFSLTCRKHHCRKCGCIFCNACASGRVRMGSTVKPVRVCDSCFHNLLAA